MTSAPDSKLRATFGGLVGQTARQWRRAVDIGLRPYGLTEATWLPLVYLARAETPMRQKDLATLLSLDNSSVVRLLDALQTQDLIERREEPSDRRVKTIHLTNAAHAVIKHVEAVSAGVRTEILSGISEADLQIASDVLRHVCGALGTPGIDGDE